MNVLDGVPILALTPSALAALGVLLIFTGRLVPWRLVAAKDRRIEKLEAANTRLMESNAGFRESVETNNALIRSIIDARERHEEQS